MLNYASEWNIEVINVNRTDYDTRKLQDSFLNLHLVCYKKGLGDLTSLSHKNHLKTI